VRPAATIVTVKLCLATVKHCPLSRILRVFLFSVRCIAAARGPTSPIPCEASLRSLLHASASILFLLAPASNVRPPATTNRRPSAIFLKLRHPEYFSSLFNLLRALLRSSRVPSRPLLDLFISSDLLFSVSFGSPWCYERVYRQSFQRCRRTLATVTTSTSEPAATQW